MASKHLFSSWRGKMLPRAEATNHEGAPAYALSPRQALAQLAATGCLNATFYAGAGEQLDRVLELAAGLEPEFVARTAVYSRERGRMKDMPALLCAWLTSRDTALAEHIFPRVVDTPRMLRSFVQILRSGAVGRKSLGTAPKRMVQGWLASRTDEQLFRAAVGQAPSLADVIKMVHPRPQSASRRALYGYLLDRSHDERALPELVRRFEAFKAGESRHVPEVPFQMLTALELGRREWTAIALAASWQTVRMSLNTFARHGVLSEPETARVIAARLRDREAISRAGVLPYQLLAAFRATGDEVPEVVREALQDAMEIAIEGVPRIEGSVCVCPDVSGSMQSPVTGLRRGATTAVRCVDVAALVAAAILRRCPGARVLPFEQRVVPLRLNARDSVMTNAARLAAAGGGGTAVSAPLALLNREKEAPDLVVLVSDNQSWVDAGNRAGTQTLREWQRIKGRNARARLVCIDIQPYATTQAVEREDVLNVGGFSDAVFELLGELDTGRRAAGHWVEVIESVQL